MEGRRTGHGRHASNHGNDEASTDRRANAVDGDAEACEERERRKARSATARLVREGKGERRTGRGVLDSRVTAERERRLGHADREVSEALLLEAGNLLAREVRVVDAIGAVELLGDRFDLLLDGEVDVVEELERVRLLASCDDGLSELDRSGSALRPVVARDGSVSSGGESLLGDEGDFGVGVGGEAVDGDDDLDTDLLGVLDVTLEVGATLLKELEVLARVDLVEGLAGGNLGSTAVHLEGTDGSDEDNGVGDKARSTALDIDELLHSVVTERRKRKEEEEVKVSVDLEKKGRSRNPPDVGTETSLGNNVTVLVLRLSLLDTGKLKRNLVGQNRRVSVRDVGERTSMDKDGSALERLHEVGLDRVLHEDREGASATDVVAGDGDARL